MRAVNNSRQRKASDNVCFSRAKPFQWQRLQNCLWIVIFETLFDHHQ